MRKLQVEVVYALADRSWSAPLDLPVGSTIRDALDRVRNTEGFAALPLDTMNVGVWGELSDRERVLVNNDRVEIYRALVEDPVSARRRRAQDDRR